MLKRIGCINCKAGQIFVFLKDEEHQALRIDVNDCSTCRPDSPSMFKPFLGEEVVAEKEYFILLNQGWATPDI